MENPLVISKADLHIHTKYSDGAFSVKRLLNYVVKNTDLKVIAITDHGEVRGAKEAKRIVQECRLPIEVIAGEEIYTTAGEIVGLFIKRRIPHGLTLKKTIRRIHQQGGLAVAVHPYVTFSRRGKMPMRGIGSKFLKERELDAVEAWNASPVPGSFRKNWKVYLKGKNLGISMIGGSDAHILRWVGKGFTLFPGSSAVDLRQAIENRKTVFGFSYSRIWEIVFYISAIIFWQRPRELGKKIRNKKR